MTPSWILAVDATGVDPEALRAAVAAAAGQLGTVHIEERGEALVLAVAGAVHPAVPAIVFPAALRDAVAGLSGWVRLVVDRDAAPDRALDLAAVLRGSEADPPLLVALTEEAWRALSEGDDPVPLRDFRHTTIYRTDPPRVAWIHRTDDGGMETPAAAEPWDPREAEGSPPGRTSGPPPGRTFGPPPGPDFPTDR